jgi:hypothetical protein
LPSGELVQVPEADKEVDPMKLVADMREELNPMRLEEEVVDPMRLVADMREAEVVGD